MVVWLVNCRHLDSNSKFVELNFSLVLEQIKPHLPSNDCYEKIQEIIETKRKNESDEERQRLKSVDDWIERIIRDLKPLNLMEEENLPAELIQEYDCFLNSILNSWATPFLFY